MTKYDWLEFGTRMLGVWFVATGMLAVIDNIQTIAIIPDVPKAGLMFFRPVAQSFLGTMMVMLTPGFIAWLRSKDAHAKPSRPSIPSSDLP